MPPSDVWKAAFTRGEHFLPDWYERWTKAYAEEALGHTFKFKGPGWYFAKNDTFLVLPTETTGPEVFLFCFYNGRNPIAVFGWVIQAPIHMDDQDRTFTDPLEDRVNQKIDQTCEALRSMKLVKGVKPRVRYCATSGCTNIALHEGRCGAHLKKGGRG